MPKMVSMIIAAWVVILRAIGCSGLHSARIDVKVICSGKRSRGEAQLKEHCRGKEACSVGWRTGEQEAANAVVGADVKQEI